MNNIEIYQMHAQEWADIHHIANRSDRKTMSKIISKLIAGQDFSAFLTAINNENVRDKVFNYSQYFTDPDIQSTPVSQSPPPPESFDFNELQDTIDIQREEIEELQSHIRMVEDHNTELYSAIKQWQTAYDCDVPPSWNNTVEIPDDLTGKDLDRLRMLFNLVGQGVKACDAYTKTLTDYQVNEASGTPDVGTATEIFDRYIKAAKRSLHFAYRDLDDLYDEAKKK